MKRASIYLLILLTWTGLARAQEAEKDKSYDAAVSDILAAAEADSLVEKEGNTLILPVLGYTPDTSVMLGAAVLKFFYLEHDGQKARPSVFSPTFIYTINSQIMVFMGTDLNWGEGQWHSNFGPSYIKFPDQFYGIGRDVSLDDEEDYTPERIAFKGMIERETWGELRLGLSYQILQHRLLEVEEDGIIDSGDLTGSERSVVSAPGVRLGIDTRDNTWYPSRGIQLQAKAAWARDGIGSDYDFEMYELDLRGYTSLGKEFVLAGQYITTSMKGDVPFYMLPQLGGDNGLRGYRGSLYRDQVMAMGRVEIRRMEIFPRMGMVVFGGIGDVAPSPSKLTLAKQLWTVGGGLRLAFDQTEKVNIRIDYGLGNGDSGFFLSLGEAF